MKAFLIGISLGIVVIASFKIGFALGMDKQHEANMIEKVQKAFSHPDTHICIDSTHATCDGNCVCDGLGCPPILPRDYQLDLHMDTVWVYDGDRLVDRYITTWGTHLDSVLLKDNL